jgi:gliding motility-associated-like protein
MNFNITINLYKKIFLILFFCLQSLNLLSQSQCPNSDFSNGNFDNWNGSSGIYSNPSLSPGINLGTQSIITTSTQDPYTCGGLSTIPVGETFSAQLGNDSAGGKAQKLTYDLSITNQNSLFIYKYALVLQDAGHAPSTQPGFTVQILDSAGNVINPNCGVYNVYAGQPNQNFQSCGDIRWLPWTSVGLNLSAYVGQNLKIEFTTRDCAFTQHFGYAYISAKCTNLRLNVKTCSGGNLVTLSAPSGFSSYAWTYLGVPVGTPTQSISFPSSSYPVGAVFECTISSFSNGQTCSAVAQAVLGNPILITPDFNINIPCGGAPQNTTGNPINFTDNSGIQNDVIQSWNWDFGDGTSSTSQNPVKVYLNSNTYNVKLTVTSLNGCTNFIVKPVTINNNPLVVPTGNSSQPICSSPAPTLTNLVLAGNSIQWFETNTSTTVLPFSTLLVNNTTYFGAQTINGCISLRIPVLVTLINSPVPTGIASQTFCDNDNPKLQQIAINGTLVLWYADVTSTTPLPLNTPLLNGVSYFATQNNGCGESLTRFEVTTIIENPITTVNSPQVFCEINHPTINDLTATGTNIKWYNSNIGGTALSTNSNLISQTYYVTSTNSNGCEGKNRLPVVVDVSNKPKAYSDYIQNFCDEDYPKIQNFSVSGNNVWYNSSTGGSTLLTNETLISGTTYYTAQIDPLTNCESTNRTAIKAIITPCEIEVFNTITINNNNQNDYLYIKNIEYFPDNSIEIFDKFGKLVYEADKYGIDGNLFYGEATGDDVILKSKKLPTGTYYYVVKFKNLNLKLDKIKKGFLYIINNE